MGSNVKIAVLSDIHSNYEAFKTCVDYMEEQGVSEYILLGDYVSDTAQARETMDFLYELISTRKVSLVRGNREEYFLNQRKIQLGQEEGLKWQANSASGNLLYTYERLEDRDFEFLDSLPISMIYKYEDFPAITCCHGSPANAREWLGLDLEITREWLRKIDTEYLMAAHTHYPGVVKENGKTYINTGSVGIAIGDAGLAQCYILHGIEEDGIKRWEPEFVKIPYNRDLVLELIESSGLHAMAPWFINSNIQILLTGIDNSAALAMLAPKLQTEDTGVTAVWPCIDEKYFAMAAQQLGVPDYRY